MVFFLSKRQLGDGKRGGNDICMSGWIHLLRHMEPAMARHTPKPEPCGKIGGQKGPKTCKTHAIN